MSNNRRPNLSNIQQAGLTELEFADTVEHAVLNPDEAKAVLEGFSSRHDLMSFLRQIRSDGIRRLNGLPTSAGGDSLVSETTPQPPRDEVPAEGQ